jgi:hypothetical protein
VTPSQTGGDPNVYALTSGEYSDYTVHCVFERAEDAVAYALAAFGIELRQSDIEGETGIWWEVKKGSRPRYPGDRYPWAKTGGWRIETYQFWTSGVVPTLRHEAS